MKRKPQTIIPVMEIFGPTIQGEGMVIGRKTMFVRTGGCDYSCSWCDSKFTWDGTEKADIMTPKQVYDKLKEIGKDNFNHVTLSGGNPALVRESMEELIDLLHADGIQVGLETQGSIFQPWFTKIDDLTISPKPPSSKMQTDWEKLDEIIAHLEAENVNYSLKVVIFDDNDFEYAKSVYRRYEDVEVNFYVSAGNEDSEEDGDISKRLLEKLDWLWDKVIEDPEANNFRPLPQLHALVWDNKRGV